MKNLFLLTVLLLLVEISNVNKTNEVQSIIYEFAPEIAVITILASIFLVKYLWEKCIHVYLIIFLNIFFIKIIVFFNTRSNKKLKKRVEQTQQKHLNIGNLSAETTGIAVDNIALWNEQIKLHDNNTAFYKLKKSLLVQRKNDLRLLTYLTKQVRKEPNAEKKLYQLEASIAKVSESISHQLTKQLNTKKRKDNIVQLTDRIINLGTKAG